MAKIMAGLLLLLRKDENDRKYKEIMDIIYAGYQSVKKVIKKLDCLEGKRYKDSMYGNREMKSDSNGNCGGSWHSAGV